MKLNPWQFAIARGRNPYGWQVEAMEAFGRGYPVAIATCNGAGKTTELAGSCVDWFFRKHPQGQLVATSSSFNQLSNQTWTAIKSRLPSEYRFTRSSPLGITTPQGGVAMGFSTKTAGNAEGWHPKISPLVDPVMLLIDEAKTVPDAIWSAFDRCTLAYILIISSPGPAYGRFFECFHSLKKFYWTRQVPSSECLHIPSWKRERDKEIHGEDSAHYRSTHLAEFTEGAEHLMISKVALRAALDLQPLPSPSGEVVGFWDFARGGDENVFALRRGNVVEIVEAWREKDTTQAIRRFIHLAQERGVPASCIWGDADGLGGPMVDQARDEGFRINEFHGGASALDSTNYANLIAEVWYQGLRKMERGRIHLLREDRALFNQLINRFAQWSKTGKKKIESKEDMKKRGVASPDRADAILGCIMMGSHMTGAITAEEAESVETGRSAFDVAPLDFGDDEEEERD